MARNGPKFGTTGDDALSDVERGLSSYIDFGTNDTINGLEGNDLINIFNGNDWAFGAEGNDEIFDCGSGNDEMHGGSGDDIIHPGTGFNTIDGGAGNDTVDYHWLFTPAVVNLASGFGLSTGWDTLISIENVVGTVHADFITGDANANILDGGSGHDTLRGGGGADTLYGRHGDDILEGGSGADVLLGDLGFDYASYESSATWVSIGMNAYSSEGVGTGSHGDAEGDLFLSIEGLIGSAWDDSLIGDNGNNRIYGGAGNDVIGGGVRGNDILDGGAGDDLINGGEGSDVMTGGAGADKFSFHTVFDFEGGLDVITDFVHGVDKIDLSYFDARPDIAGKQSFYFDKDPDSDDWFDSLDGSGSAIAYNGTPVIDGDTGEVTFRHSGGNTYVYISTDDVGICAALRLNGEINLTASDFIL